MDNILAALEHNYRICELWLYGIPISQLNQILAAMHQPFPELTYLSLGFGNDTVFNVPASFLGGSAPRLQTLRLFQCGFPELPRLLLSATHLVHLCLSYIPYSGYISPEAMVTCLSVLTRLEFLGLEFDSPNCCPYREDSHLTPHAHTLLPVFTTLLFKGHSGYLEDLVARIDAPLLNELHIFFFHRLRFDTPQLSQFISRSPKFKVLDEACVVFSYRRDVSVTIPRTSEGQFVLQILPY
jgi:hypothetical protein